MNRLSVMFLTIGVAIGLATGLMLTPLVEPRENIRIALWLEVAHRVCTSVGGLGTVFALLFVVRQFNLLHTQSELVQKNIVASMDAQLYTRLDSFNRFIVDHDKEYELLNSQFEQEESADRRSKLHHLCDLGFTFFEEIFKHHVRYDLLETEDWDEWQQNMAHFFSKPYVRGYWRTVADRYARTFSTFANDLVARMEPRQPEQPVENGEMPNMT